MIGHFPQITNPSYTKEIKFLGGDVVRKRIICVVLCVLLVCSSFCLTAFADSTDFSLFDFLATYVSAASYNDVASDPDRLVDYWDSNPGKLGVLLNLMRKRGIILAYVGAKFLDDAVDARYIAATVDSQIVNEIYNQSNSFAGNDYRFYSLSELHLTTGDTVIYDKITVTGSIPVTNAGSEWIQSISSKKFGDAGYYSVTRVDDASILCYPGGVLPPLIYVPPYGKLYQDGVLLPPNYIYVVLGDNELLQSNPGYYNYAAYYTGGDDSANDIIFGISRGVIDNDTHNYVPSVRGERCNIYSSGLVVGQINDAGYLGWSMVDLFVKMCGFVISDGYTPPSITPPTDIPYDDDDNVVVMVPIDEPGEPVYMSPTEYNNYINNGDIYNTDDHSNNVVSNDTINNIINNYNTYDDSKILNKLDIIIDYLDKIYRRLDSIVNPPPSYDNFVDITAQVPLIGEVRQLIIDLQAVFRLPSDVPHIDFELFGVSESIRFDWYLPYQGRIKNLLKGFAYLCGVVSCWLALKSSFGVTRGGED